MKRARHLVNFLAAWCVVALVVTGAPVKKKTAKKPVAAASKRSKTTQTASRRTGAGKTATSHASHEETSGGTSRAGTRRVVVTRKKVNGRWVRVTKVVKAPSGPTIQPHPDSERYQQIQQALAANGYFKGEANGQWGDDSVAALKQFQTDKKLPNDGRISALSLIGLGLGPNRETASAPSPTLPSNAAPAPANAPAAVPPSSN